MRSDQAIEMPGGHTFDRIVIPLDGSPTAEAVLPQVIRLLQRVRAEVVLVRAIPPSNAPDVDEVNATSISRAESERYLDQMAARLRDRGVPVSRTACVGEPDEVILDVAQQSHASLVAMTTHGRSAIGRMVFGSVTENVLLAPGSIPVLVVRSLPPEPLSRHSPPPVQELPFAKILVPCDGSEESMSILGPVAELARLFGSFVILLTVHEDDIPHTLVTQNGCAAGNAAAKLRAEGIQVNLIARHGDPAGSILDVCREQAVDLLAMATHGRRGLSRLILGSVTDEVVRRVHVPMLIARCAPGPLAETAGR